MTEQKDPSTPQLPALPAPPVLSDRHTVTTHRQGSARYFWLLLLLMVLACAAGYYWLKQHIAQMQLTSQTLSQQVDQLHQQLAQLGDSQQQTHQQVNQQQQQLTQVQQQLGQQQQQQQLVVQLQWLINNANQQLLAYHNIDNSLQLLRDSQQLLPNEPQFSLLAQALEQDIQRLSQLPKTNENAQVSQLISLAEQAASLPLPELSQTDASSSTVVVEGNWWQRLWQNSQQFLKQFITVTPRDNHYQLPLSAQQRDWLQENLRSYLLLASQAIWHQQPSIYQQALQAASVLVTHYFATTQSKTEQFLQQLQQLQQQPLPPAVPLTLTSQQALIALQHQQSPSSSAVKKD